MLRIHRVLLLACLLLTQPAVASSYSWSVVPQFTGTAVHRDWTPLLRALERDTELQLQLRIYDSIAEFEKGFLKGEPDFAYMNPYHAVMARQAQGYQPIVRNGTRLLTGILVVRADSDITQLRQLDGKAIAFPSPNAFAASLYMRALLAEKEGLGVEPYYAGTHSNAYRQVLLGKTPACGAVYRTLYKETPQAQQALRVLYQTPSTPSHPLTAHPRVATQDVEAIQQAMVALGQTPDGQRLLQAVLLSEPMRADYARDYQPLEKLQLEKFVVRPPLD